MRLNDMRIFLLTVLVLAAASVTAPGAALATPQRSGIAHPTAPTKVVLRVSSGGGFVTPQTNLRALPSLSDMTEAHVRFRTFPVRWFPAHRAAPTAPLPGTSAQPG